MRLPRVLSKWRSLIYGATACGALVAVVLFLGEGAFVWTLLVLAILWLANLAPTSLLVKQAGAQRALKCFFFVLGIGLVLVIRQWPRWVLMSDVRQAKTIIVKCKVRDRDGVWQNRAFELDDNTRPQFVNELDANLGLDYTAEAGTFPPTITIYLARKRGEFLAAYTMRPAQGPGLLFPRGRLSTESKLRESRCPAMEVLREIASHGRRLSEGEMDEIFSGRLRSKWPGLISFDYTLPVVRAEAVSSSPLFPAQEKLPNSAGPSTQETPKSGEANPTK